MSVTSIETDRRAGLRVENLAKTYGSGESAHHVLSDISVEIGNGELVSIVGPSGAGKTTLLRCLGGLLRPSQGRVLFSDTPVTGPLPEIAVVFQDYRSSLMPWMRVRENVAFPLQGVGVKRRERRSRAEDALTAVGLDNVGGKYPWQLSGGMQQRVAIARALAYDSSALLMDEPFGSVDAQTRSDLEDLVLDLRSRLGITIGLITHDIDEAIYLGDRVVVLSGTPTTVVDNVPIELGTRRDQISTKSAPHFGELRTRIFTQIRATDGPGDAAQ